jgi:hypothetical protein
MPRRVSGIAKKMSHGDLLGTKRPAGSKCPIAIGMPPGQDIAPGGRANRLGIEIIEAKTGSRHFIEKRSFEIGMAVVAHFFPTVVISHQENNVRPGRIVSAGFSAIQAGQKEKSEDDQLFHVLNGDSELIR